MNRRDVETALKAISPSEDGRISKADFAKWYTERAGSDVDEKPFVERSKLRGAMLARYLMGKASLAFKGVEAKSALKTSEELKLNVSIQAPGGSIPPPPPAKTGQGARGSHSGVGSFVSVSATKCDAPEDLIQEFKNLSPEFLKLPAYVRARIAIKQGSK
jgi:hypothetical protein